MADVGPLYPLMYEPIVRRALEEDLGLAGDVTSDTVVPEDAFVRARLVARRPGRVAGLPVALSAFRLLVPAAGDRHRSAPTAPTSASGGTIAAIEGPARPILTAERTALNLLCGLCGIATATRTAVEVVAGTRTRIVCTRKTTPGLRALEKYAVRVGGGVNHRFGLDDGVLIKDNHIVAAGGIEAAVAPRPRAARPHGEDRGRGRYPRPAARGDRGRRRRGAARQHDAGAAQARRSTWSAAGW